MSSHGHLLDASALIAAIANEPGAEQVRERLDDSAIHSVNLAEVIRKFTQIGVPVPAIERNLHSIDLRIIEGFTARQAVEVGRMGLIARQYGL